MHAFDTNMGAKVWVSCGALLLALAACSSDKRPAQQPAGMSVGSVSAYDESAESASAGDREATVQVSRELRERCNIPTDANEAPRFEYDQSTLRTRGENILDSVAQCLSQGPMKDQTITIVGRTDPRGTPQYNQKLGTSRAVAAKNYLVQRGVAAERVRVVSRGEQGARGSDEATWALDRRVDLELGDRSGSAAASGSGDSPAGSASASPQGDSPILEGTRMQIETSEAQTERHPDASSYATTAEGAQPSGSSASGSADSSASGSASGSRAGGTIQGSGSVKAGSSAGSR